MGGFSMTVQEIITMIQKLYPRATTWTDAEIVTILNSEQREIFRELDSEEIYEFTTVADQWSYSLPSDCAIEFLKYVGLTTDTTITSNSRFQEYSFAEINDELSGYEYFDAFNGLIGLYPMPDTTGWNVRLIYTERPTVLSASSLTASPSLNADWHRILVYATISEIAGAGSNPDIATVNNYTMKYNALMKNITQSRYERTPKYPSTKDVMRKKSRYCREDLSYLNPYV
jgi:hypothetical protein